MCNALVIVLVLAGCGATVIAPGHRGLVFDSAHGLRHEVLEPGAHRVGSSRIVDYDVTYTTRFEPMRVLTKEAIQIDVKVAVIYRPIIAELFQLETEIGPQYYDEVIGPELRSATRAQLAEQSFTDLTRKDMKLEDEIEANVRERVAGKHVEVASVVIESVLLPPELAAALRARQVAEQDALREKTERERAALRAKAEADEKWEKEKVELEHDVERKQLQREAH